MSRWDWNGYETAPRRKAEGGIKAKSQRGSIGETWWSKRFVSVLEAFNMGARLTRGRSYARSGQVMGLEISPGLVKAKVQGSRSTPYKVAIRIPVFSEAEWLEAEEGMAAQAIFLAQLLAGEMPTDIESAFRSAKLSLFPSRVQDLETDCSCPDWANPCKHIAATYYILAEAFDQDPFLLFQWRGRSREKLQDRLARFREAEILESMPVAAEDSLEPIGVEGFWIAGAIPRSRPTQNTRCDFLVRQLGPSPVKLMGRDFGDLLEELVRTASQEAVSLLESS
jgi:uncharacterized Zn finger protein